MYSGLVRILYWVKIMCQNSCEKIFTEFFWRILFEGILVVETFAMNEPPMALIGEDCWAGISVALVVVSPNSYVGSDDGRLVTEGG